MHVTKDELAAAVADAHLPALLVTLAHLSGDESLLREAWQPRYTAYTDNRTGGLPPSEIEALRAEVVRRLPHHLKRGIEPAPLSPAQLRRLMRFVAGADVPDRYLPMLEDELGIVHVSPPLPADLFASDFRVLVVGAGMSGLLAGIRLKQAGIAFDIVERNGDVGGTWLENNYPGCRVDSQNHIYSYSFAPNHDWPQHFSTQDELLAYFRQSAERFGVRPHIRFNTSLEEALFDDATGTWHAKVLSGSVAETGRYNAIISAVGQLNRPKIPEIDGQDIFAGPQFHSARWRHDVDLTGRRVAVVGTGASAFQLIPRVAETADRVTIFQRSAPWVAPTPDYHFDVGEGQKWLLKNLPLYANWYRFWLFWTITDGVMAALKVDPDWQAEDGSISAANQRIRSALVEQMRRQVGARTDLLAKIVPQSPFGGKRTLRDNGQWIETLKRDNVEIVTTRIAKLTADAVVTADGASHPADAIIYGTGFHASRFLEPIKVFGRGGRELTAEWAGDPKAHLGITVPGYPNFFMVYGPNTNLVAQGSIVFFSECAMTYIMGCLDRLRGHPGATMDIRRPVFEAYNARIDAENAEMAWGMPGVTNWYKSASGRVSQNWPFPLIDYWTATRAPNPDEFDFSRSNQAA